MKLRTGISVLLVAALSCAAVPPCGAQSERKRLYEKSYALVIGISEYLHPEEWKKLGNAKNDAGAVAEFLKKAGFVVVDLYDKDATKKNIVNAFLGLSKKLQEQGKDEKDGVVIYFAGHGSTQPIGSKDRGFIVPYDGGGAEDIDSYIGMEDLKKYSGYMDKARHQLFILDSCYGGTLGRDDPTRAGRPPKEKDRITTDKLKGLVEPIAREVLTAGGKDQEVADGSKIGGVPGHSLFTGQLLSALGAIGEGAAADYNHDGYITFNELVNYIYENAQIPGRQTPHFDNLEGHVGGAFVFVSTFDFRQVVISPVFELAAASEKQNDLLELRGPEQLYKQLEIEMKLQRISNMDFQLADASQEFQVRGDGKSASSVEGSRQKSDYTLEMKYWPLDKERVRVEARFKKNAASLTDIPVQQAEVTSDMDFQSLARQILQQFVPNAGLHLRLSALKCKNCPPDMQGQIQAAMERWVTDLNLPRIKYVKEGENKSEPDAKDVNLVPTIIFSNDFNVYLQVNSEKDAKTFGARENVESWKTTLNKVQEDAKKYLEELLKKY